MLLDGLTRLGRAHNLAAPPSARVSGGFDAGSIFPVKQLFGAARKIENGGSLTMIATATVDSASTVDALIFEELVDASNQELRLSRELLDAGMRPAVDILASGTRQLEHLMSPAEIALVEQLRRTVSGGSRAEVLEQVLERLRSTQTNIELLTQLQK